MLDYLNSYGSLIVTMVLGAVLGLSLYLPLMAGQLSLASPGFYALGGYVAAILSTRTFATDGTYPVALVLVEMLVAGVLSGALAVVVGLSALRLSGIYLALATIAFVEILRVVSLNLKVTGKAIGIFQIPQPFGTKLSYLWLAGPLLLAAALFTWRLERVRTGRAFAAIREDELAAAAMGIDTTRSKVRAFVIGGVLAGLAGVVAAHLINSWNARQGTFDASIIYLSFVLIGGSRTFLGPIAGGMALTYLPEWLRERANSQFLPEWAAQFLRDGRLIIYGVLLALSCVFFPQGFITPELMERIKRVRFRRRPPPKVEPEAVA
ncbi:MAG TPA: branched-chain amino acid ABC transporter permease [Acidimicrobiia bacterium]